MAWCGYLLCVSLYGLFSLDYGLSFARSFGKLGPCQDGNEDYVTPNCSGSCRMLGSILVADGGDTRFVDVDFFNDP